MKRTSRRSLVRGSRVIRLYLRAHRVEDLTLACSLNSSMRWPDPWLMPLCSGTRPASGLGFAPDAKRDVKAAKKAFRNLVGPKGKIGQFYSYNAPELISAANELEWVHPTSTPFRSQSNGAIERKIQHVEEGTRTILHRSGMPVKT